MYHHHSRRRRLDMAVALQQVQGVVVVVMWEVVTLEVALVQ